MKPVQFILDLIYPPKCPFCGRILERGEIDLCFRCQRSLPWTVGENRAVDFCDVSLSPLRYEGGVRQAVHRYKFDGGRMHSRFLGTLMAQCLQDRWSGQADGIVWVPLSKKHRKKRGYDQAELMARRVGELTRIPVLDALEKIRNTATQSRIEQPAQRRANVLGAYRLRPGAEVKGLKLILIDDVVTSGATLAECAACLRIAGAEGVVALTLACAKGKHAGHDRP